MSKQGHCRFLALSNHSLAMTKAAPFNGARGHDAARAPFHLHRLRKYHLDRPAFACPTPMAIVSSGEVSSSSHGVHDGVVDQSGPK